MQKFFLGILIFVAALVLQFFAASFGFSFDLAFATVIALAFMLDFAELLPIVLLDALILNWQPALSPTIVVYLVFPILAFGLCRIFPWESWIAIPSAVVVGTLVAVFSAGAGIAAIGIGTVLGDVITSMIWALVPYGMMKSRKR